jgi:protein NrfD
MNTVEFVTTRANPGIDPVFQVWEWPIPVYLFLAGLVAGMMIVASVQEWRSPERWEKHLTKTVPILAIVLLSLGMLSLYFDLEVGGLKLNVVRLYMTFRPTSVISWGAWFLLIAYPCLVLWLLGSISPAGLARFAGWSRLFRFVAPVGRWAAVNRRKLLIANTAVGTCLGTYTGVFLSGMVARPVWHSGILGPLFLVSGISTGAGFLALLRVHHDLQKAFIRWDIVALFAESSLLALFLFDQSTGAAIHGAAAGLFFSGPFAGAFFGLVVLTGILAPMAIGFADLARKGSRTPALAPILGLIGGVSLRFIMVYAGQALS